MSTTTMTGSSRTSPSNGSSKVTARGSKPQKIITLSVPKRILSKFPSDSVPTPAPSKSKSKASTSSSATPMPPPATPTPADKSPVESQENTPAPDATADDNNNGLLAPPTDGKKKGIGGPKPGAKRSAAVVDNMPKPRGKPGPKKKPRLADGTIDQAAIAAMKGPFAGPAPISTHKLGPKAKDGIINAGLRALDRSGKPCRRWEKKGLQLKSFTGVQWDLGSWRAPKTVKVDANGDVRSDTTNSSDVNVKNEGSGVPSEQSNSGADNDATPQPGIDAVGTPVPAVSALA